MNDEDFDRAYHNALALRDQGNLRAACVALRELTGIRPNSAALIAVLGDVYSELGNVDAAIEAFREAVRLAPTSEIASLGLFHCLWRAKKEREAFDEIRRFMSLSESQDYRDIVNELWEKRVKSRSKAV